MDMLVQAANNLVEFYDLQGGGRTDFVRLGCGPVTAAREIFPRDVHAEKMQEQTRNAHRAELARNAVLRARSANQPRVLAFVKRSVAAGLLPASVLD